MNPLLTKFPCLWRLWSWAYASPGSLGLKGMVIVPGNDLRFWDLFGMVISRDPNSKLFGDLQRLGIRKVTA